MKSNFFEQRLPTEGLSVLSVSSTFAETKQNEASTQMCRLRVRDSHPGSNTRSPPLAAFNALQRRRNPLLNLRFDPDTQLGLWPCGQRITAYGPSHRVCVTLYTLTQPAHTSVGAGSRLTRRDESGDPVVPFLEGLCRLCRRRCDIECNWCLLESE